MRRAILDVDGTLWDLHNPLQTYLRRLYPNIPEGLSKTWNWFTDYMTEDSFYAAVEMLHKNQIDYPPLQGAHALFNVLRRNGSEIFVCSYRETNTAHVLSAWLAKNDLEPYSMVYTGKDKLEFVRPGDLVIDDAPDTIERAIAIGAEVHYLGWPWNKGSGGNRYSDLYQLLGALNG